MYFYLLCIYFCIQEFIHIVNLKIISSKNTVMKNTGIIIQIWMALLFIKPKYLKILLSIIFCWELL